MNGSKVLIDVMARLKPYFAEKNLKALGVGCFGPIDLNRNSPTYGYITTTPKIAWRNFDILDSLKTALHIPIGFDTDVNAAALGEASYGITRGLDSSIYITIGTGIGVGVYINGKLLHGMLHPEAGHILLSKGTNDTFKGKCPYHANCFEGLAAGPAIEARYGKSASELSDRTEVWELEAYYIAQALVNYTLTYSPGRIVLGGGVMHQSQLYPIIRKKFVELMNGYITTKEIADIDTFIVPSSLNDRQGVLGCMKLAMNELAEQKRSRLE